MPEKQQQQQQLRQLERTIRQADDGEQLQRTLLAYGSWLADRRPGEQEDLRVLPAAERIALIQRYVREDEERALRHLSDDDAKKLRNEVFATYERRKDDFERAMRRTEGDIRVRLEGPLWLKAWVVILWELRWNDDKDDERERELVATLSPEQQEYWRSLPERSRTGRTRRGQLMHWVRDSIRPRWGPEELEKFFTDPEKVDNNQRERLLTLPRDQFQTQLERLYLAHTLGVENPDEWLGDFGPGAGLPPGPGGPGQSREGRSRDRNRRDGERGDSDRERSDGRRDGRRRPPNEDTERTPPPDRPSPPQPDGPSAE